MEWRRSVSALTVCRSLRADEVVKLLIACCWFDFCVNVFDSVVVGIDIYIYVVDSVAVGINI